MGFPVYNATMTDITPLVQLMQQQMEAQQKQTEVPQQQMEAMVAQLAATPSSATATYSAASIPTFTPFDSSAELWKDYRARF